MGIERRGIQESGSHRIRSQLRGQDVLPETGTRPRLNRGLSGGVLGEDRRDSLDEVDFLRSIWEDGDDYEFRRGPKDFCKLADKHNMDNSRLGRNNPAKDSAHSAHKNEQTKTLPKGSERWLLSVLQNTSDVVTIVDADGTLRYVSPSIERMFGYRPEELVGTLAFDHVHHE